MNTFEFPPSTITYLYFIPDIHDLVFVPQGGWYYAAIAVDGYNAIEPDTNEPSPHYAYQEDFRPQLIKLRKPAYEKIMELLEPIENPFNLECAVCMGIIHRQGAKSLVPFLAMDRETNEVNRLNLIERRGRDVVLGAVAEVTTLRPSPPVLPRKRKRPVNAEGRLAERRTEVLGTLLDRANELPDEQLSELLRIVEAATVGRYIIKMRPTDMHLPHIQGKDQVQPT